MITRYSTGQSVLIPATIRSAEEVDGKIIYQIDANFWDGIPEEAIVVNEEAEKLNAMRTFRDALFANSRR